MPPTMRPRRLQFDGLSQTRHTHQLFKFPAKFHPPVVRELIGRYTSKNDIVLDPFCGSGSALVECAVSGRKSYGVDVDPLAVFVSRVKTRPYDAAELARAWEKLHAALQSVERPRSEYERLKSADISKRSFSATVSRDELEIPAIPNLDHWFRRYVTVDLAHMLRCIDVCDFADHVRDFFRLCLASCIRIVSNADPVPVSGLEVTAHMRRREAAGRLIDTYATFRRTVEKSIRATGSFTCRRDHAPQVILGDARELRSFFNHRIDVVITSPPYHNAVDYYRRHQLEMFWLGLTRSQNERLQLLPRYIGRPQVAEREVRQYDQALGGLAAQWERRIARSDLKRAGSFRHYLCAMRESFEQLMAVTSPRAVIIFVVGKSAWNGQHIPTPDLFAEIAAGQAVLDELLWYPVVNRYMSYKRRNDASIDKEYVMVMRRV